MTDLSTMLAATREWALTNYERGGDVIVEAFTDTELAELIEGATTSAQAIRKAAEYCGLHGEQKANVLSQSGEHDAEAAQAMENARRLS